MQLGRFFQSGSHMWDPVLW